MNSKIITIFVSFFLTISAVCPNGSVSWQTDCYFFQANASGFPTAESDCNLMGGHLVSIHDGFVNALLTNNAQNLFHESTVTDFWIGFTNLMTLQNWTWMDESSSHFTEWCPNDPNNTSGLNCTSVFLANGCWRADDCFKTKPYICKVNQSFYDPSTTTTTAKISTTTSGYPPYVQCSWPFTYFEPTHSCYGVGNWTNPLNWTQAEQYCQAFDAHLTSIHSKEELLFVESFVMAATLAFWTGGFSNDGGKTWAWSDRTLWDYNPWDHRYPHLNASACVAGGGSGAFDQQCNTIYRVMCKKPL